VYAAAAGSALALSTSSATADIFYSGIQNIAVTVHTTRYTATHPIHTSGRGARATATHPINIGGKQFAIGALNLSSNFYHTHTKSAIAYVAAAGPGAGVLIAGGSTSFQTKRLSKGATISVGAGAFRTTGGLGKSGGRVLLNQAVTERFADGYHGGFQKQQFPIGRPEFAGIRLGTGGGKFDYGWIQLEVGGTGIFPNSVTAIDWAYNEVPGQSIEAGQGEPATTPEPGGRGLALLAAGCLGVLAWRKRRAQRAA
jgi:hypothetical protein